MKHCDHCNLDFPEQFRFCGACGGGLSDSRRCPGCGEVNEGKWAFCTSCGSKLSADAPPTLTMPTAELPSQSVASPPPPELKGPQTSTEPEKTIRYNEPGELYSAEIFHQATSVSARAPDWAGDGDESVTAEIRRDSDKEYATATRSPQVSAAASPANSQSDQAVRAATVAALPLSQPKSAPT